MKISSWAKGAKNDGIHRECVLLGYGDYLRCLCDSVVGNNSRFYSFDTLRNLLWNQAFGQGVLNGNSKTD